MGGIVPGVVAASPKLALHNIGYGIIVRAGYHCRYGTMYVQLILSPMISTTVQVRDGPVEIV